MIAGRAATMGAYVSHDSECPQCGARITAEEVVAGMCPACMLEAGLDASRTRTAGPDAAPPAAEPGRRFLPGAIVAGRFRVVSLLGRGGMGEVYRADDLKLGQPVALKFLSESRAGGARVEELLKEVKLARQVSHPNVCRVYDIGEVEGVHFLSMEYVDGEDLAVLLRRVDHVPRDRALRIARQICAGLAAAHDQGILHRDLKPGNVMIDGRGRAKITDFGLAELERGAGRGSIAGTPCYMAPEQAAAGETSVSSDIYSLGLVLYELFTGVRVFDASTPAEMERLQSGSMPPPSKRLPGFDPGVERVIRRCLEADPRARPASAQGVAAALPGGDPLAAAVAAGETLPPDVVAEAGGTGTLRPAVALVSLVLALAGIGLTVWSTGRNSVLAYDEPEFSTPVMAAKAREMVERLGYLEEPADEAWMFYVDDPYVESILRTSESMIRWDRLGADRPTSMNFWYRQSPRLLARESRRLQVGWSDPPRDRPGMISLKLDGAARLRFLSAVPARWDPPGEPDRSTDWSTVFEAAGLDESALTAARPERTPATFCDSRRAWSGAYPGQGAPAIRVEACAYRGRVTYFEIDHPWTRGSETALSGAAASFQAAQLLFFSIVVVLMIAAGVLARRNLRAGRGDRRSAFRIGAFVVVTLMIRWALVFHHLPSVRPELVGLFEEFAFALFLGFTAWLMYIALEPFARRVWPKLLISWIRLMNGRIRDPIVGRHALFGALLGLLANASLPVARWLDARLGHLPAPPAAVSTAGLHGVRALLGGIVGELGETLLFDSMLILFLLVFLRFLFRSKLPALIGLALVPVAFGMVEARHAWISILAFAVLRTASYANFGLVGAIAFAVTSSMVSGPPLTLDVSSWYFSYSLLYLMLPVGLVLYASWISLGDRPLVAELS